MVRNLQSTFKMSDASDEVMLRNGRFGGNTNGRNGSGPRPRQVREPMTQNHSIRSPNPIQHGQSDSRTSIPIQINLDAQSPGRPSVDEELLQVKPPSNVEKAVQKSSAPPEALEELKRLQQKVVAKAHLNRFKELDQPSTNPEALVKARDGPGTDLSSDVYRELSKSRAVPGKAGKDLSVQSSAGGFQGSKIETGLERYQAQWTAYSESQAVYPVVEDGRLVLLSEPMDSALVLRSSSKEVGLRMNLEAGEPDTSDQPAEHNWGDAFYADWEYRPRACSNFEAFRDWFRRWLETTISICCYVDIYHPAFFDGTAHPDGEASLLIPDFDDHTTRLDWNDEESRLHCHETVEGYCYNWALHLKREEEEEQERRVRARNAYIESIKSTPVVSPQTPKANLYLRPVESADIPELLDIFNYYIHKSTLTIDITALSVDEVRERIETYKRERMPFIVAAERRSVHSRDNSSQKILGYALATDTLGDRTSGRFTAELELFVRPEYKRRGIGKCLMDKLLEVCDPTYNPLGGYFFDASFDDRSGYYSGGRRRLARLMFVISYPYEDRQQYKWLHEWLVKGYGFEQQGLLRGTRIKFNRL